MSAGVLERRRPLPRDVWRGTPPWRRVPHAAWACALLACLNAVCWSILTPPFEAPDEPAHFAYVKQLAETGRLPKPGGKAAPEVQLVLNALDEPYVVHSPETGTIATAAQQRALARALAARGFRAGSEHAGVAASEPPLYYALQAIPYTLARGGTLLDRLALMRLLSALMGAATALFAFLFVRELLPRERWAWTVGGACVALCPLLGFSSGAVSPDAQLFAVSASLFYVLARAFRRGLDTAGAVAIGVLTALGFLTKLNFLGLAPGVLLGVLVLSVRAARACGRPRYRLPTLALGIAASPVLVYLAANVVAGHPLLGRVTSGEAGVVSGSLGSELSFIWQLYLPRLPGMHDDFYGLSTLRQLWFDGYVGRYGWLDTIFPGWVYDLALAPAVLILALCARALFACREALRARLGELLVYAAMAVGLMALIGATGYSAYPQLSTEFAQARYLLPLLPLAGAVLALAARGAGRRWGPVAGALLIVLFLAHDVFSQLQEVARFYG
jgi:4-amino-4-deoxy-L-arabinose transferase-like glycosyltransferase